MRAGKVLLCAAVAILLLSAPAVGVVAEQPPPDTQATEAVPLDPGILQALAANEAARATMGAPARGMADLAARHEAWYNLIKSRGAAAEAPDQELVSDVQIQAEDPGGGGGGVTVPLGTTYTFSSATEGKNDRFSQGLATSSASYVIYTRRNNVSASAWGIGSASGWAWTGTRFSVTGSGSRSCYVDFVGWAGVNLLGAYGGRASWKVKTKVYDVTAGAYVGEATLFDKYSSNNVLVLDGGSYSRSVLVSLQAGHTYVAYVCTYGDVNQWGVPPGSFISRMLSGSDSLYTRWDQIRLRWQ